MVATAGWSAVAPASKRRVEPTGAVLLASQGRPAEVNRLKKHACRALALPRRLLKAERPGFRSAIPRALRHHIGLQIDQLGDAVFRFTAAVSSVAMKNLGRC